MAKRISRKKPTLASLTIKQVSTGPLVLLDSSFVMALLDKRDSNHDSVKGVFGFIDPYNCRFNIPLYVFAEVISKFIQREGRVSEALKITDNFLQGLHGVLIAGSNPTVKEIIERYKKLARKKIRFLQSNDFFIATEGMLSGSLILTCDFNMYTRVKRYHQDIFFVAKHSKKYRNDIPKFIERFLALAT